MLPGVLGIADQFPAPRVHHQVGILQRNLTHEQRDLVPYEPGRRLPASGR